MTKIPVNKTANILKTPTVTGNIILPVPWLAKNNVCPPANKQKKGAAILK